MTRVLPVSAAASFCLPAGPEPAPLSPLVDEATGGQRFRRINRFIELTLIGAHRCRKADSTPWPDSQPLVIATGQGNIADTTEMLELVVGGGHPPMPFQFINLAGNMAGFYLAQSLGAVSANTTVSQLDFPLEAALEIAAEEHQRFGSVLVGAVDELAWPLADHRIRLGCAADADIGEGSHWLRIGGEAPVLGWIETPAYCRGRQALDRLLERAGAGTIVWTSGATGTSWQGVGDRAAGSAHPVHDTLAGAVICEFLAGAADGATLAHVSTDGRGRYAVIRAGKGG